MANYKILSQGAEAIIILSDNFIIKSRTPKSYRIKILDDKIRKSRTKSETKLLEKASKIINCPKPTPAADIYQIKMPFLDGKKLSEHLNDFSEEKQKQICEQIGKSVAKLHDANIIHGDLTTSNMILVEDKTDNFNKLITEFKKLNLPVKEYAIFGSAPLAIRNLRDSRDLDIFVSEKLFKEYKTKKEWKLEEFNRDGREVKMLKKGEIELYPKWGPGEWDIQEIIDNAEIIDGISFACLKDFIKWKKISGREKDQKDLELIKKSSSIANLQRSDLTKSVAKQSIASHSKPIIFFIDFGLGFISRKLEDKAVDLHLLKQALEARHFQNWEKLFDAVLEGYSNYSEYKKVLEQLKKVEKRGRYRH